MTVIMGKSSLRQLQGDINQFLNKNTSYKVVQKRDGILYVVYVVNF